jgi:hypothetical protein
MRRNKNKSTKDPYESIHFISLAKYTFHTKLTSKHLPVIIFNSRQYEI